jgi:hypothetical protein
VSQVTVIVTPSSTEPVASLMTPESWSVDWAMTTDTARHTKPQTQKKVRRVSEASGPAVLIVRPE